MIALMLSLFAYAATGCRPQPAPPANGGSIVPTSGWRVTVPVTGATGVVDSVTITRALGGVLGTYWYTKLSDGSKAMLMLGRWEPNPSKGIPTGRNCGQISMRDISVRRGIVSHAGRFTNKGLPHPPGEYFVELTVMSDSGVWQQPEETARLIEAHGTKDKYGDYYVNALARFTLDEYKEE
jgi:hypothetical protein